jgi:hypothetical protein
MTTTIITTVAVKIISNLMVNLKYYLIKRFTVSDSQIAKCEMVTPTHWLRKNIT